MEDASTPLAPLTPQNQGVGLPSTRFTSRMPVGNPHPISIPPGAMTSTDHRARIGREEPSKASVSPGRKIGSSKKYPPVTTAHRTSFRGVSNGILSEMTLPSPVERMIEKSTIDKE